MSVSGRIARPPHLPAAPARTIEHRRPTSASRRLGLKIFLSRERLDGQLAHGSLQGSTAALELRASQLESPRERLALARGLRRIVNFAERNGTRRPASSVQINGPAVTAARQELLDLAERLEGIAEVSPRGAARVRLLITDRRSPLFNPAAARDVVKTIWWIEDSLEPPGAEGASATSRLGEPRA